MAQVWIELRLGKRIEVARHQVFLAGTELKLNYSFPIVSGHFLELDIIVIALKHHILAAGRTRFGR